MSDDPPPPAEEEPASSPAGAEGAPDTADEALWSNRGTDPPDDLPGPYRFPWERATGPPPNPNSPPMADANDAPPPSLLAPPSAEATFSAFYGIGVTRKKRHMGLKIGGGCCVASLLFFAALIVLAVVVFRDYSTSEIASFPVFSGSRQIAFGVGGSGSSTVESDAWTSSSKLSVVQTWYRDNLQSGGWAITSMPSATQWDIKGVNGKVGTGVITFASAGKLTDITVALTGAN